MQEWIIAMLVVSILLILRDMAKTVFSGRTQAKEEMMPLSESHPQKEKVERYAASFRKLADTFYGMPYRKEFLSGGQLNRIISDTSACVCSRCYQREICWGERAGETMRNSEHMLRVMEEGRLPPKTLHLHLLNQLKDLKLRGVKCNHITVKHIFPGHFRALHQVAVCRRKFHQPAGIFPADPEHEPAVCLRMVVHNGTVPAVRRNYHHIPIAERVSLPLNLNRDVPLHKKIELIIVVRVRIHF